MKKLIVVLTLIIIALGLIYLTKPKLIKPTGNNIQTAQKTIQKRTEYIKNAGLTIEIPQGFIFSTQEQMNLTTNMPYAVNFYIQNYKNTVSETEFPYQLYAIYQWDTDKITKDEFQKADFMLDTSTRKEFTIDNRPAVSGMIKGERSRYTIHILNNGHVLTIAISETTNKQREITESVIKSIKFD